MITIIAEVGQQMLGAGQRVDPGRTVVVQIQVKIRFISSALLYL